MVCEYQVIRLNQKGLFNIKRKSKIVPVLFLTKHHAMKTYLGSGGIAPHILDIGTIWR